MQLKKEKEEKRYKCVLRISLNINPAIKFLLCFFNRDTFNSRIVGFNNLRILFLHKALIKIIPSIII